jgi:hypothetical protein
MHRQGKFLAKKALTKICFVGILKGRVLGKRTGLGSVSKRHGSGTLSMAVVATPKK